MNPPCYRCTSTTPLQAGRVGLCPTCEAEVRAEVTKPSLQPECPKCGYAFLNDWERIQHVLNNRHHYRAFGRDRAA